MRVVDIAAAAGVSPSTISRFLHGSKKVAPETRQRIQQTIRQLGYIPALQKGRKVIPSRDSRVLANTVAALAIGEYTCLDYACSSSYLRILEAALADRNLHLLFLPMQQETLWTPSFLQAVAGVIILHGTASSSLLTPLAGRPLVSLVSARNRFADEVLSGHCQIGKLAGRYLVGRGLRNLAVVNPLSEYPDRAEQARGLELFVRQAVGLRFRDYSTPLPCAPVAGGTELQILHARLEPLVDQLLAGDEEPTGLFVPSEWAAVLIFRILRNRGVRVRERFVFICSGYHPDALAGLVPRPASIEINLQAVARQTVNMLMLRMRGHPAEQPFHVAVEPNLLPGD